MALAAAALAAVEPACGSRYQQLQNEEEPGEPEQAGSDAPPPYSSISAEGSISAESAAYFDYKDESGFPKPPSYNVATTLPSYDEAERTKAEATIPLVPGRDEDFVGRDDFDDADQLRIGNDGIFMLTFFMAFLFNWIGFFLSFCLTTSAAGRYGAISGFGLSLIKWILIVRFSTYFPGYFDGQYWLWWVFLVLVFCSLCPFSACSSVSACILVSSTQNPCLFLLRCPAASALRVYGAIPGQAVLFTCWAALHMGCISLSVGLPYTGDTLHGATLLVHISTARGPAHHTDQEALGLNLGPPIW
ncbi:NEDD4 family-interacting protein 1 isoform X2 [Dasypus novemcinctus]|uniref:NEDD4 family-interacting protein 1 isoform X2 n=1 Tax=Dasypus novemcinctus TaxID=9361 RepID=UPI0039C8FDE1